MINMTVLLNIVAIITFLFAHSINSVDIAFTDGDDCTGIGLYGTKSIPYLPCSDLSSFDPASSVHMRKMTNDQVLHFFSDSSCQITLHSTDSTDDQCFTSPIGRFGSFQVSTSDSSMTIYGRDSSVAETTDVSPYEIKMSNYTDFGTFNATKIDLGLIGAGLVGLGASITLYGAVNTCIATMGPKPSPKDYFDCSIQPVATILGLVGTTLIHHAGKRLQRRLELAQATVMDLRKRTDKIDTLNAGFVHSVMNNTIEGDESTYIGSAERCTSSKNSKLN
jgi:hypothetical protein